MEHDRKIHHFYRIANRNPPKSKWFQSHQERRGNPDPSLPLEVRASWGGCSAYDTEDGARKAAREQPALGHLILRFDIPEGSGITWTPSGPPGHFDLRGGAELLKRFLAADFEVAVLHRDCVPGKDIHMRYRLWDTDAGQLFGAFETEEEALSVVRILVASYGDEIIDDLGLAHELPDGSPGRPLNGMALVRHANQAAATHDADDPDQRDHVGAVPRRRPSAQPAMATSGAKSRAMNARDSRKNSGDRRT